MPFCVFQDKSCFGPHIVMQYIGKPEFHQFIFWHINAFSFTSTTNSFTSTTINFDDSSKLLNCFDFGVFQINASYVTISAATVLIFLGLRFSVLHDHLVRVCHGSSMEGCELSTIERGQRKTPKIVYRANRKLKQISHEQLHN